MDAHQRSSQNTMTRNLNQHCKHCPGSQAEYDSSFYETDEFRMYTYKVMLCSKHFSHDWTSCPFTHLGERACRRDPRTYLPILCPFFKDDEKCRKGESCKFSHGLFEYFLHPGKYRTSKCTNGTSCDRKVCFFAHTERELRDEWNLTIEQIHEAFEFNAHMPVAIAPRQVLRALSGRSRANFNSTVAAAAVGASIRNNSSVSDTNIVTPATAGSAAADPPTLSFDFSSPASIWSAALNALPYDFAGLDEQLKEIVGTSRNSNSGEDAPVWTREYRLWN